MLTMRSMAPVLEQEERSLPVRQLPSKLTLIHPCNCPRFSFASMARASGTVNSRTQGRKAINSCMDLHPCVCKAVLIHTL